MKKALLIINIGTPDKPEKKAVRRFLFEFLNDRLVIDIPWLLQKILVNLIIIPFRLNNSTKLYQRLWTKDGSPLMFYQSRLVKKLNDKLKGEYDVYSAMRYGNPSLKYVLKEIQKNNYEELIVLPHYPQYATSTTLSTINKVNREVKNWKKLPTIKYVDQFYDHPAFIGAFVHNIKKHDIDSYDHVVFSYHGLPDRQVNKLHPPIKSPECSCHVAMPDHGRNCYKATCYQTTRLMAKELGLEKEKYTVSFQSRLSKNWLMPFTDDVLRDLLNRGKKRVLVVSPAFVTDCLETEVEIGFEYNEEFLENGGEKLQLVESLNDSEVWVNGIAEIVRSY
ncbi:MULTISPECIES: ferrochelatase [unclassified Saccharicrinis]|uniref:ferrochelatase n=1 Tax=unclassified Saccharicrinis TaxID=2646859 RepID=UPI003D32CA59